MIVNKNWKFVRLRQDFQVVALLVLSCQSLVCWSLNEEGLALLRLREKVVNDPFGALSDWKDQDGEIDHCSWFGVECSDGKVIAFILRNNSFTGTIPEGIRELKELELLDLGYNNFSKLLPSELGSNLSLTIKNVGQSDGAVQRGLLQQTPTSPAMSPETPFVNFSMPPSPHGLLDPTPPASSEPPASNTYLRDAPPVPRPSSAPASKPSQNNTVLPNASDPPPSIINPSSSHSSSNHRAAILGGSIGGAVLLLIVIIIVYLLKTYKVSTVKPWATGLSGQLQKAFVTGVLKLKRSELEAACEDFSNVIGSSAIGTVYKGTVYRS
ncbi:Detected protein of confused Function [Hibiscus syriacus]|uniref:Detected protein of confused Function n=1 Tax=Hibiscus syriacus TaxID=106335 RepID=A0A6A2WPI4_HIBSY|nr:Detected protein of confused Function [Hibiscus syriacus]